MTGLSIKTLSEAMAETDKYMQEYQGIHGVYFVRKWAKAMRLHGKCIAALAAKSERMEALEDIAENGDRLARAAEIVMCNLAHPEGASWPLLYDLLRSRMYTYTEARDGAEAARRYGRAALAELNRES